MTPTSIWEWEVEHLNDGREVYVENFIGYEDVCHHTGLFTWESMDYATCNSCGERMAPEDVDRHQRWINNELRRGKIFA